MSLACRLASRMLMWLLASLATCITAADEPPPLFETDVWPILREYCLDCHGATEQLEGGLDLRLVRFMLDGGDSGPAVVPGSLSESYLLERVESGEMPPGQAEVSADKVDVLRAWIAAGAIAGRQEPETLEPGLPIMPAERGHWAFQPIERNIPPSPAPDQRAANAIDAWLMESMPAGLELSPAADRPTLVKRLYLTLLGLPPSVAELERWSADPRPDWYASLVDQLLSSPHYGERWGRHWLDLAGYADSEGYTVADAERSWAWKYRDYVVRAMNSNKPLDRFLIEQLAGDELAGPAVGDWTGEQIECLTATGFLRMAADGTGSGDNSPEARNRVMADTLQIIGSGLMGLSLHCAQCHDHRYDPIPHTDYFAIRAVLEPALDWQAWRPPAQRLVSLYTDQQRQLAQQVEQQAQDIAQQRAVRQAALMEQALEAELAKQPEALRIPLREAYQTAADERTETQRQLLDQHPSVNISPGVLYQYLPEGAEELKRFDQQIAEIRAGRPPEEFLRVLQEPAGHLPVTHLFHRGDHQQPRQPVEPGGLSVLAPEGTRLRFASDDPAVPTSGRRLAFAHWLVSDENPLVARVLVNRLWMHHFGRGLVATPTDFGKLGTEPSHAELLDWLASELRGSGWDLKHLQRLIVSSAAWQQSSFREPSRDAIDPENHYYWRWSLQRLDAESLRDRMLTAAGWLDRRLGGPPLSIKEDETGQVIVDGQQSRRSLYIRVRRSQPVAMLQAFDAPVMEVHCERRTVSTVATQSLMLLNGEFPLAVADQLASTAEAASSLTARVDALWLQTLGRRPCHEELRLSIDFVDHQRRMYQQQPERLPEGGNAARQALANLGQMLVNSNEFLYLD
jgi:hypothetical protein